MSTFIDSKLFVYAVEGSEKKKNLNDFKYNSTH